MTVACVGRRRYRSACSESGGELEVALYIEVEGVVSVLGDGPPSSAKLIQHPRVGRERLRQD